MRRLSMCISSWHVRLSGCSARISFLHEQTSVSDLEAQCIHQILTRTLSAHISSWRVHSVHTSVSDADGQCTHQFLTRMLSAHISSWRTRSVHASVPYAHDQHVLKGPVQICNTCFQFPWARPVLTLLNIWKWRAVEYLMSLLSQAKVTTRICKLRCCYITVDSATIALQNGACTYRGISKQMHHKTLFSHNG
jgi:hypothetical protein